MTTFVQRYHADPVVAYESSALVLATQWLADHAATHGPSAERAREALTALAADPLCEANLRATILRRLRDLPPASPRADEASLLSSRL